MPFNRNTGVCLLLDMEYMNYDKYIGADTGIKIGEEHSKVACIVTVSRVGTWCSMGSEVAHFETPP